MPLIHQNASIERLTPLCNLKTHEDGIAFFRAVMAETKCDNEYMQTETTARYPVWGSNDDWSTMNNRLGEFLHDESPKIPEVNIWPAAYFKDGYEHV